MPKKTINGLEIEGVIPYGMGEAIIQDGGYIKKIIEGRFWCINYSNIAIVASVVYSIVPGDNKLAEPKPIDWAAYVGATPSEDIHEEETVEFAWRYGAKLAEKDARHIFPQLKDISYRQ